MKKYQESGELAILWAARDNLSLEDQIVFNAYLIGNLSGKVSKGEWKDAVEAASQLLIEAKAKEMK